MGERERHKLRTEEGQRPEGGIHPLSYFAEPCQPYRGAGLVAAIPPPTAVGAAPAREGGPPVPMPPSDGQLSVAAGLTGSHRPAERSNTADACVTAATTPPGRL